jgi:ribonucleoside-diphosphate reductase alpha chain
MKVTKRNGELEELNIDNIHRMLENCKRKDLGRELDVSVSETAINAHIKFADNMSTSDIQQTLIKSAAEHISTATPDYSIFAGRLLVTEMRKEVYGSFEPIPFIDYIDLNVESGLYDPAIIEWYTEDEINYLGSQIDYDNDFARPYSSIVQMDSKYLIKDAKTNRRLEMPQETFMLIAMVMFAQEDSPMGWILNMYEALKDDLISLPTPIISGVRTKMKMYSSCCKIKMGDHTESILAAEYALSLMTARRAGIGVDMGPVRGILAPVKNNTVKHTGALPLLKAIESSSKQFTQNSLRTGATVVNYPVFNWEIMDVLEYKNNQGSNTNRARFIDYSIGIPNLFIDRVLSKGTFTLFSSEEVPELFDCYGDADKFKEVYEKYEADPSIRKKVLDANTIFNKLVKERVGTGRIYIHFVDNVNKQGMFDERVTQTNLCSEIFLPTRAMTFEGLNRTKYKDVEDYDLDDGMISLCILGCVNFGKLENIDSLDRLTRLMVRFLDNLIEEQKYPMDATEWPTKGYRFLGIGISDFAHFLAKNEATLGSQKARTLTHQWAERFQYGLITASVDLAAERGACEYSNRSAYSRGIMPIDTYNKNVDQITPNDLNCDWEKLSKRAKMYGIRNMTLSAIPPTASSSLVSNSTQGIDPIQSTTDTFEASNFTVKSLVPDFQKEEYYMKAWDMPGNTSAEYIKLMSILQKFIDQGMSTNQWYDLTKLPNKTLDSNRVKRDIITAYKYGLKSLYYIRSKDKSNISETILEEGCESGACAI